MRTPRFHFPRVGRPHTDGPKSLDRVDILALVLAVTLAAAVGAALWAQS